jgi:S1-C subfamily serine protease
VIVSVGDAGVTKAGDLQRLMVEARIGASITLLVLRGDQLIKLDVTPVELK